MPLLRKPPIGTAKWLASRCLNVLSLYILVSGGLMIIMVLAVEGTPNFSPGWLLIFLGLVTMTAGVSGIGRTVGVCFFINVVFNSFASFGSAVFGLALFSRRSTVLKNFHSKKYSDKRIDKFLQSLTWAYLALFVAEILSIFCGIMIRRCASGESYETLEDTRNRRELALGKMRQDLSLGEGKSDKRKADSIADKMKDKYGKWSHEQWN
ncbi:hypothetical protein O6H91_01G002300 [Diphasiastrum complanatum]|uniref:Uncharacterized protein n=1 Tax=Diphasiastrum complanatum TaxID=34168 RepID=A0ACC2EMM3_DIPCM|nr:hypothetical protein O6H91_01G002300 [Diphasiastrum complanatum]